MEMEFWKTAKRKTGLVDTLKEGIWPSFCNITVMDNTKVLIGSLKLYTKEKLIGSTIKLLHLTWISMWIK